MRNIIHEIEMKRGRYNHNESITLIHQLENYEIRFKGNIPTDYFDFDFEPFHFIPVIICSAFESFFRTTIKEIVDLKRTNSEKINKITEIKDLKFTFLSLEEIKTKEISSGEIVSQILKIKGIDSIDAVFSTLLNTKFLNSLKSFISKSKEKNIIEIERYWLRNYNAILKDITSIYRLRNIVCHEFGFWIDIKKEVLFRYLKNSIIFLEHVNLYLNSLFNPLPQKKSRIKELTIARKSFLGKEKELNELITKIYETLNNLGCDMGPSDDAFQNEIMLWKKHRQKLAKSNCEIYMSTKNYRLMYWSNMEQITTEKIDSLLKRNEALFFEAEVHSKVQKFD